MMVVRNRDKLREEIKAVKQRKKEEKRKLKLEAKLGKMDAKLGVKRTHAPPLLPPNGGGSAGTFKLPDIYYESSPQRALEDSELPEVVFEPPQHQTEHGK